MSFVEMKKENKISLTRTNILKKAFDFLEVFVK